MMKKKNRLEGILFIALFTLFALTAFQACSDDTTDPPEENEPVEDGDETGADGDEAAEEDAEEEPVADGDEPAEEEQTEEPIEDGDEPAEEEQTEEPIEDGDEPAEEEQTEEPIEDGDEPVNACETPEGWPPDEGQAPWYDFSTRSCLLPECDDTVVNDCYDSSGLWKQILITTAHSCPDVVATFDPRLQIGHEAVMENIEFNTIGECSYGTGGVLTGVYKGDTGVVCEITTEADGMGGTITVMTTGIATYDPDTDTLVGTAKAFLYDLPMGTPDCHAEYDMIFERME